MALNFLNNGYFAGKVGIGTQSGVDLLAVHNTSSGTVDAQMNFTTVSTGQGSSDGFRVGWNGTVAQMYLFENADMRFATNNTEKMRITSAGGVGIGNITPIFYSGYSSITLGGTSGATKGLIKFGTGTSNDGPEIFTNTSKDLYFNKAGSGTNMILYETGTVRFNNYNSANQTGTPTYILGTDSSGNVVKVLGADIPGVPAGSGTVNTVPLWTPDGDTLGDSNIKQDSNGNIGIGSGIITTPPQDIALTIQSTTNTSRLILKNSSTGIGSNDGFRIGAVGTNVEFEAKDFGDFQFFTAATQVLTIKSSGNVGIGVTGPTDKLAVNGNLSIFGNKIYNGSASNSAGVSFPSSTTRIDGYNGITFHSSQTTVGSQTERMRVTNAGNVGIGTTNPAYKLDVNSSAFVGARIESTAAGYAPASILLESGNSDSRGQGIYQYNSVSKNSWFSGVPYNTTSDDWIIAHKLETTSFNSDVAQMSNALFCVNDNGNVGIGTTSPTDYGATANTLEIRGASGTGAGLIRVSNAGNTVGAAFYSGLNSSTLAVQTAHPLYLGTNNSTKMTILSNGNVGIGTTSPLAKLQVGLSTSNAGSTLAMFGAAVGGILSGLSLVNTLGNAVTGQGVALDFHVNSSYSPTGRIATVSESTATPAALAFYTYNGGLIEKMRITSAGGISFGNSTTAYGTSGQILKSNGNASPTWIDGSAIPGVPAGSGTTNYLARWTPDGDTLGNSIVFDNGTNVGIGTSSVGTYKLNVNGAIRIGVSGTIQPLLSRDSATGGLIISSVGNSGDFIFQGTGGSEKFRIKDTGDVGIGTTTPDAKLNITDGGTQVAISNTYLAHLQSASNCGLAITAGSSSNNYIAFGDSDNYDEGIISYNNSTRSFAFRTADGALDDLVINSAGNVGIGTTSPDNTLDVVASDVNITPNAESSAVFRRNGNNYLTILSNASNEGGILFGNAVDANDGTISYRHNTQSMQFSTADVERMRITAGGNVGINTTIPSEKLDVDGNVRVRNLTAGIVTSSATGVLSTGGPTPMNMSLGEGYAGNIREKYYRTNKTVYPSAIGSQYAQLIQQGIFNSMSLIMSPIATETAVVSSPAPNDGSGDFSFNRNSPGSRVGSDGYIVRETQNLFIQSNDMSASSAWTLGDATLTGGQTGYTGAPNAWRLNDNATNTSHIIRQTPGFGGTVTVSIYAKAGTKDYLYIRGVTQGASARYTYFKLTDGTLGTVQGITAFMEAAGGGWYRCSVTYDHNPAYEYYFGLTNTDDDPSYAGDGTGNIYFMNPQLENGIGAREYIPTTTVVKYAGVTTNVPRIDYLNNIPELLIEPNSTNVVYDGSHMAGLGGITESFSLSPEGIINGIKINETATTGQHYGHVNCSVVSGAQYFLSVYMKKGTSSFSDIYTQSNTISSSARINFDNVTIAVSGGTEGFIYDVGGGWYRVGYKTPAATQANTSMDIYLTISSLGSYAGDVDNYTEYYGVQLETSSILTSLIQTYAGAVTRAHEQINLANMNANNIAGNATTGTLMMEFSNHYNGIAGDSLKFHQSSSITGRGYLYVRQMGFADTWGSANLTVTDNVLSKAIWRLNSLTDGSCFLDGVKGNNSSGTAWGNIGKIVVIGNYGTMRIRNIFFAPLALTDTQCVTLTTINE
mgnify:FL=1